MASIVAEPTWKLSSLLNYQGILLYTESFLFFDFSAHFLKVNKLTDKIVRNTWKEETTVKLHTQQLRVEWTQGGPDI